VLGRNSRICGSLSVAFTVVREGDSGAGTFVIDAGADMVEKSVVFVYTE
jgi:hypothetical protein